MIRGVLQPTALDCALLKRALSELAFNDHGEKLLNDEERACARRLRIRLTAIERQIHDQIPQG